MGDASDCHGTCLFEEAPLYVAASGPPCAKGSVKTDSSGSGGQDTMVSGLRIFTLCASARVPGCVMTVDLSIAASASLLLHPAMDRCSLHQAMVAGDQKTQDPCTARLKCELDLYSAAAKVLLLCFLKQATEQLPGSATLDDRGWVVTDYRQGHAGQRYFCS